jgi:hypothetical protein
MYRYQLRGRSLTIPGRIIRLTVIAANADDARRVAAIRNPDFGHTIQTPRRLGRFVDEQADGLTASKAREFVEWRGTMVEVVD